jgi:hypothetical protein
MGQVRREICQSLKIVLQPIQHAIELMRQIGHFYGYSLDRHAFTHLLSRHNGRT